MNINYFKHLFTTALSDIEFREVIGKYFSTINNSPLHFVKTREVKSPIRGTAESAGIDFFLPELPAIKDSVYFSDFSSCKELDINITTMFGDSDSIGTENLKGLLIQPGEDILIPSGIHVNIPKGYELTVMNKSGVCTKLKLIVGAELIDSDYQGELHFHLFNLNTNPVLLLPGQKVVQMKMAMVSLVNPVEVETLDRLYTNQTERGTGGFNSTGTF